MISFTKFPHSVFDFQLLLKISLLQNRIFLSSCPSFDLKLEYFVYKLYIGKYSFLKIISKLLSNLEHIFSMLKIIFLCRTFPFYYIFELRILEVFSLQNFSKFFIWFLMRFFTISKLYYIAFWFLALNECLWMKILNSLPSLNFQNMYIMQKITTKLA